MKKFNPEKEIAKLQKNKKSQNTSKMSNLFIPALIVGCSCLAMTAVTFSAHLESNTKEEYRVHIDIINGDTESYDKIVLEGTFNDTISSSNTFGSIECTSGYLDYDPITETISTPYLNRNTSCVLVFTDDGIKKIGPADLPRINDNNGVSYYYKVDQENNYVLIKDMMFRIVRTNGDGSIRLVLDENILASTYGETNVYNNSNIKNVLNDWYLKNFATESYVVESDYDNNNYVIYETEDLLNIEGYQISKVGTLSVREYAIISSDTQNNYLTSPNGIYLSNGHDLNEVYAIKNNEIVTVNPNEYLHIRPIISINAELIGTGTKNNPYTIK